MKRENLDNLEKQQSFVKLDFIQICYIIYAGVFGILCRDSFARTFDVVVSDNFLLGVFIVGVFFSIFIFLYNRKYEEHKADKQICFWFGLMALAIYVSRTLPLWISK
ncbi:MAG: hypothetical protein RSB02_04400 [Anaerovoracaceae bacterium]